MQTFIVRVWVPGVEGVEEVPLRGFVTDASSGLTFPFFEPSELVELMEGAARGAPPTERALHLEDGGESGRRRRRGRGDTIRARRSAESSSEADEERGDK